MVRDPERPRVRSREAKTVSIIGFKSGSSLGSTSEPYIGRGLEPDSDPWVQGSVQPSSELEPAPNRTQITLELNRRGWTQTDIIELLWGVKKGGTKGYQIALEEYRAIVAE
jgi:hypothetical protein